MKAPLSESAFQEQVIAYAQLWGWRVAHCRKVRVQRPNGSTYWETPMAADGAGWPDLVLVHRKRKEMIFAELKTDRGTVEPEQQEWLTDLETCGQDVMIWRPRVWDEIQAILEGRT